MIGLITSGLDENDASGSTGSDLALTINALVAKVGNDDEIIKAEKIHLSGLPQTADAAAGFGNLAEVINAAIGSVLKTAQTGEPSAPNFAVYPTANSIDPNTQGSSIWGVGWSVFPNKIGAVAKPLGPDGTNAAEWALDSGYAAATLNDASVATITGGYDHICNQIAGTISGGGHNFIQYNAEGHSFIGGGSYNWIQAGRATILAGTNNRVSGTVYNAIYGGFTNKILDGFHNTIIYGQDVTINTPADGYNLAAGRTLSLTGVSRYSFLFGISHNASNVVRSVAIGGQAHTLAGTVGSATIAGNAISQTNTTNCFIGGGENATMTGSQYAGSVGGFGNTQTGRSSFMACAEDSNDNGARGLFTGRKAQGLGAHFQATIGCNHPTTGVLSQAMKVAQGATTTGTNLNAPTEQMITVGNTGLTVISGSVHVVARNRTDNKTAGWRVEFVGQWDGTNYFLNGATADLAMTQIYADATNNITAPTLAFSAGQLRVRFGGTAGKTINWSSFIDCTVMRAQ